ncbi:MAG: type II secretion system inner membrane protein GspF [Gammaproteobacteria bacterium]|nr:type II secretion system inner membrane protein GspF [Gammaproteobacteria bacterium]MDH5800576.1 type II secretion system inner membrane protein GspF [Gammaproteobacteria bacterium]
MGAFEYTALDAKGRETSGVMEGDAARQIRQQLREQGLTPLAVEEVQQREAKTQRTFFRTKISGTQLALITRQWATLVRSGLPVEEALRTVGQQAEKARLKSLVMAVRSKVMEGHSLANALAEFPHVFSELYRATIEAGEQSGHLDVVLERLADYTETRQQLTQKMSQALIYPVILTLIAIFAVAFLLTFVVPKIVQVFENINRDLPLLTQWLIKISEFLGAYWLPLLISLFVLVGMFAYFMKFEGFRFKVHLGLLRIPLIGRMVRGVNAARFARTLSIVASSGVPILDGLRISAQVVVNLPMRKAVDEAAAKVREGSAIHKALDASKYFPPMTIHLIASGEASGNIEEMLERAAESQERELESITAGLLGVFEPVLILVMGGVVLVIVLAILLPIFDMNQSIK